LHEDELIAVVRGADGQPLYVSRQLRSVTGEAHQPTDHRFLCPQLQHSSRIARTTSRGVPLAPISSVRTAFFIKQSCYAEIDISRGNYFICFAQW
jgi:hypothetical protein